MRTLFIGDIVALPDATSFRSASPTLWSHRQIDLVIANGENSASGFGITPKIAEELLGLGIEVLQAETIVGIARKFWNTFPSARLLRPANFAAINPGGGLFVGESKKGVKFAVLNLQGRVFLAPNDDPFKKRTRNWPNYTQTLPSSWWTFTRRPPAKKSRSDGISTAASPRWSEHTRHVATADEHVAAKGTAYITDVGMTGPHDGVIGMDRVGIIKKFLDGLPARFEVATAIFK